MTKILLVADTLPPNIGGSETYLRAVLQRLAERGYKITALTPTSDSNQPSPQYHQNVTVIRSSAWLRLQKLGGHSNPIINRLSRAMILPFLFSRALSYRPDVFIAGHVIPAGIIGRLYKSRGWCKCLIAVTYGEDVTMYAHGHRMRSLLCKVLQAADAVTCLTSSSRDELESIQPGTASKTHVIPPSVEALPEAAAETVTLTGNPKLFTLSRLVERKGMDTTIEAVALLREEFPELRYYIAGTGPYEDKLKELAVNLGVQDRVVFRGSVENSSPYFARCDLFLMPNRTLASGEREGFGIVFLEAGLHAKPSIGGRSGGAVDAIVHKETGLLVEPDNPAAVAEAIRYILADDTRRQEMGVAAQQFARRFTIDRQADAFHAIISGCLKA